MWSLLLPMTLAFAGEPHYPRKDLLIEPAELAKSAGKFRILDVRSKDKYSQGHIAGAIWIDHALWSSMFAKNQQPLVWRALLRPAALDHDRGVVIYDDAVSKDAARIWWILRYWNYKDVRLLNGGWHGWTERKLPVSKEVGKATAVTAEFPKANARLFATKESLLDILKDKKTQIIDSRSMAEHCGDSKKAKRGGAIPGAIHLDWTDLLDKNSKRFKRPDQLRDIFKKAGIDLTKPAVAHCQSGGRSSVMAFTLELMGASDVANYYRGWSEWGNDDATLVVVPKKKN